MMADATIPPPDGGKVRYTLDKSMKLRYRAHFEALKREGEAFTGRPLLVVLLPAERTACGVICSKKYSLLSVERNRARRLLWEAFRLLKPQIKPVRLVLIARMRLKKCSGNQVREELAKLLERAGLLNA